MTQISQTIVNPTLSDALLTLYRAAAAAKNARLAFNYSNDKEYFMSHTNTQLFLKIGKVVGAALFFFCGAQPAAAIPTTEPLPCGGVYGSIGCAPYGQVNFTTGSASGSVFEYDKNGLLDLSAFGTTANVRGVVDLARGQLKVYASGIRDSDPSTSTGGSVTAQATDVFTLHGQSSGPVSFTVVLTADGVGSIANNFYSGQATVSLGVPFGGGGDFDSAQYQAGVGGPNGVEVGTPFFLLSTKSSNLGNQLRASNTYSLALNTPFDLGYSLRADVSEGTTFDLLNTGHLYFILPEGVTITSLGGYGVTPVPEPESYAMVMAGLGLLGFVARRRKHKNAVTA